MAERIRLFAEHHIVAVRTARRNGEIIAVKHATFGWITPQAFYGLQKVHDVAPLLVRIAEQGYRLKWALASTEVLGVSIGAVAYSSALALAISDISSGNAEEAQILIAGVVLPFGEILLVMVAALKLNGTDVNWSTVVGTLKRFVLGQPGVFAGEEPGGIAGALPPSLSGEGPSPGPPPYHGHR